MENQRYGSLTIIAKAPSILQTNGKRKGAVLARCACGTERVFILSNLKNGNSKSCGCGKYAGLAGYNAKRAEPQVWTVEGDVASIEIKGIKVLIDAADVPLVGQYRWGLRQGYAIAKGGRLAMHRLILGLERGDPREGDHRYHNITDNRRSQLRVATSAQNKMNRHGNKNAASPFKGVHFDKARNRFVAQIKAEGKHRLIGRYATEKEAAAAYNAEARRHFGEYAVINSI